MVIATDHSYSSSSWVEDIFEMHEKFGVHKWLQENASNRDMMKKFLEFRMNFLTEEYNETMNAYKESNPEEIIDGLIDLCVIAIGTLDIFGIDAEEAWNQVHSANMTKQPGIKPSRPNEFGLPDMIKPDGWKGPDHSSNHGILLPKDVF